MSNLPPHFLIGLARVNTSATRRDTSYLRHHLRREIHRNSQPRANMSEPRRSTRARAREEATAPPPPEETPSKPAKALKRKRPPPTPKPKDSTPATPIADRPQQVQQAPKQILPTKIVDGLPLPTIAEPQPLDLPAAEYQDIQQRSAIPGNT